MPELILHNYSRSVYSEKVRALLNARQLPWRSVITSMILPRPDTMALTGGYRRIPVLQVGADVYCDTALIAAYLDGKGVGATLYPADTRLAVQALARWAETDLIWTVATLRFQPSNIGSFFEGAEGAEAFAIDRANLSQGATAMRQLPLDEALLRYQVFLAELEAQLSDGRRHVFGDDWTLADFSIYPFVWFLHVEGAMIDVLARHGAAAAWFDRMRALGARLGKEMSGAEALEVARRAAPEPLRGVSDIDDLPPGTLVEVAPTDYGMTPSRGELMNCDTRSIVIRREHPLTGVVHVHFPRLGFAIGRART